MTIKDSLFLISGLQTLVISLILFFYKSKKIKVNRYLSLFFATVFFEIAIYFLTKYIDHPAVYYLPFRFDFLTLTLLLFYAYKTTGISVKSKFVYLIPALIEFVVLFIISIIILVTSETPDFLIKNNFDSIHRILSSVYIVSLSILIIRVSIKHNKLLRFHFSSTRFKSLIWLIVFCISCIILNIFRHLYYSFEIRSNLVSNLYSAIGLLCLYYITISSLVQININNVIPTKREITDGKEELEEIIKMIENHINENKSYLNPDINLKSFSKDIRLQERIISRAINRIEHKNFNGYINTYRINECKKLLLSEKFERYSISAIADEVGFSSRASFYKNFKEIAGVSPSEYVKSVND